MWRLGGWGVIIIRRMLLDEKYFTHYGAEVAGGAPLSPPPPFLERVRVETPSLNLFNSSEDKKQEICHFVCSRNIIKLDCGRDNDCPTDCVCACATREGLLFRKAVENLLQRRLGDAVVLDP